MGDLTPLFNIVQDKYNIEELNKYFEVYLKINPNNFIYTDNIKLGNIYRLLNYLNYGHFEHRAIAGGWGYCMLVKYNDRLFLNKKFDQYWEIFANNNETEILINFNNKLKLYFNEVILKNNNGGVKFEELVKDIRSIGHYEKVLLWSVLEYLKTDSKLDFNSNICQFWNYPNLITIVEENNDSNRNNYSIGNLLLGTSYKNNKSGWVKYDNYPLMKDLSKNRENSDFTDEFIVKRTIELECLLKENLID